LKLTRLTQETSGKEAFAESGRGVQYVHWVMHKCIMVEVGGKTKYTDSM